MPVHPNPSLTLSDAQRSSLKPPSIERLEGHCAIMERVKALASHLSGSKSGLAALERKSPNDVVITMAVRSPMCKAKKGGFKDTRCAYFWIHLAIN